LLIAC